jgi:hypothetical protein
MPTVLDSQILAIILVEGFFLLGGIVTVRSLLAIKRGYASKRWPQTIGTIIESRVEELVNADGQLRFLPQVRYHYVVDGKEYESNSIWFPAKCFSSGLRAAILVDKYPVNSSIVVSYLLTKPKVSVLEPGLTGRAVIDAMFGLGFLLSSVVGGCYFALV